MTPLQIAGLTLFLLVFVGLGLISLKLQAKDRQGKGKH